MADRKVHTRVHAMPADRSWSEPWVGSFGRFVSSLLKPLIAFVRPCCARTSACSCGCGGKGWPPGGQASCEGLVCPLVWLVTKTAVSCTPGLVACRPTRQASPMTRCAIVLSSSPSHHQHYNHHHHHHTTNTTITIITITHTHHRPRPLPPRTPPPSRAETIASPPSSSACACQHHSHA